jgi:HSP20 family protein
MTGRRRELDDLQGEIQELFADLWQVPRFSGLRHGFMPQVDCFRTADPPELHVVVELAGVDPKSVEVSSAGRALVIAGSRARPTEPGARYLHMEIDYGPFQRRLDIGDGFDAARATARYDNGMLRIVVPLAEETT